MKITVKVVPIDVAREMARMKLNAQRALYKASEAIVENACADIVAGLAPDGGTQLPNAPGWQKAKAADGKPTTPLVHTGTLSSPQLWLLVPAKGATGWQIRPPRRAPGSNPGLAINAAHLAGRETVFALGDGMRQVDRDLVQDAIDAQDWGHTRGK